MSYSLYKEVKEAGIPEQYPGMGYGVHKLYGEKLDQAIIDCSDSIIEEVREIEETGEETGVVELEKNKLVSKLSRKIKGKVSEEDFDKLSELLELEDIVIITEEYKKEKKRRESLKLNHSIIKNREIKRLLSTIEGYEEKETIDMVDIERLCLSGSDEVKDGIEISDFFGQVKEDGKIIFITGESLSKLMSTNEYNDILIKQSCTIFIDLFLNGPDNNGNWGKINLRRKIDLLGRSNNLKLIFAGLKKAQVLDYLGKNIELSSNLKRKFNKFVGQSDNFWD